ncbi:MAG TPA: heat-inducible transcriptional repressor HrcA [Terriglobales bacterium]|nr:heat-inducible transcriptional repressor HrcA [Terriglobales bacterium]
MPSSSMGSREREILTAIIETYIATGEPVGSRTLARSNKDRLSPATIRNVMADLADAGLLEQPHTSAGRVPSPQGYRYYVEQLTGRAQISQADQELITSSLGGIGDAQEFLERTSHVLSLISRGVGVAISAPRGSRNELEHVYFSRLTTGKVLAVVVTRSGVVRDRVLRMERDISQSELESAANYINSNFQGWTIESLRAELERRLEKERSEYDQLMSSVEQLYRGGALHHDGNSDTVYVEGVSNLVVTDGDRERLREMLRVLEEKQRIVELLASYVDTKQEAVRVVIGLEDRLPEMRNLVLIGAPARVGEQVVGSLAVIGPTRMDYEHTITAVSYIAQLFDKVLNENG